MVYVYKNKIIKKSLYNDDNIFTIRIKNKLLKNSSYLWHRSQLTGFYMPLSGCANDHKELLWHSFEYS